MPSVMQRVGTPNPRHNLDNEYRKQLDNVDPELSRYNKVISHRSVDEIYQEFLQPSFDAFNERQKRKDRRLDVKYGCSSYLEYQRVLDAKAKASSNAIDKKGRPPIREIVWQIGNPEQGYGSKDQTPERREKIMAMLLECQQEAERRYPQLVWGDKIFHADEVSTDAEDKEHGSLHLHCAFVPLCFKNKQGPDVQVAFERCLHEMGFDSFNAWKHDLDQLMENVLHRHGMDRTVMDNHEKHKSSTEYHRQQQEIRRTKELQRETARAAQRLNAINLKIEETRVNLELQLDHYVQDSVAAVTNDESGVYDNALFLMLNCDDDRFRELNEEGRELKKEILGEVAAEKEAVQNLDQLIAGIEAGELQPKKLSWQERQERWTAYDEMSKQFWEFRADLKNDYQEQLNAAYQKRRDAMRSHYDAMYWLRRSRGFLPTIISAIWAISSLAEQNRINQKIKTLRSKRDTLVRNTADFAKFSRAYREDLKAGRMPCADYMEAMADVIRSLDQECQQFQKHRKQEPELRRPDDKAIEKSSTDYIERLKQQKRIELGLMDPEDR